jgi:site-specific recombinase XerD
MRLSKAIDGFLLFKASEGLSKRTIAAYRHNLGTWLEHAGDKELLEFTALDMVQYMEFMKNDYEPRRLSGKPGPLSRNTLRRR